jgi:hypothetical protein
MTLARPLDAVARRDAVPHDRSARPSLREREA